MPDFEILCLAYSWKKGGHCVAGLRTDGGGWIRPVSQNTHGELSTSQCTMNNGKQIALLDLVRISFKEYKPKSFQKENWLVGSLPFQFVERKTIDKITPFLDNHLESSDVLFGSDDKSIRSDDPVLNSLKSSLSLVKVRDLRIIRDEKGKIRGLFSYKRSNYNLPITCYQTNSMFGQPGRSMDKRLIEAYITISLGEKFIKTGRHYKLIAGMIPLG